MVFRWLGPACAVALLGLGLSACVKLPRPPATPTAGPVGTAAAGTVYAVRRGAIDLTVEAPGVVVGQEQQVLAFQRAGQGLHVVVQAGQKVKRGDLLAEFDPGDLTNQIQIARAQADIAQLQVQQVAAQSRAGGTARAATAAAAQSNVSRASADYAKAQDNLNKLLQGAAPGDVQSAKAAVVAAQAQLAAAQQGLTDVKSKPLAQDVRAAELSVEQAKNSLWSKQASRDSVCGSAGPNSGQCKSADAEVAVQETALSAAQNNLDKARLPATPAELAAAQQAVESAQAAVTSAQAQLADLQHGPSQADVDAAKQDVASAKAALDAAGAGAAQARGADPGPIVDVQVAQKNADLAKLQVAQLQQQLDQHQLRAPFDGVVTAIDAKDGDNVQPYAPILAVSSPAKLEIAAKLQPADLPRVAPGQAATIILSSDPTAKLRGSVSRMPSPDGPSDPWATPWTVRIGFANPPKTANLGDLADVTIDVQQKQGILLLPTTAIRTFGGRPYVQELLPDGSRREVDIDTGATDGTNTEITRGLAEGDKVISP